MNKTTSQIMVAMQVFSWIAFIGLCIKAGTLLVAMGFAAFGSLNQANSFAFGKDIMHLQQEGAWMYIQGLSLMLAVLLLKVAMMWRVLQIFQVLKLEAPFSSKVSDWLLNISYWALSAGILSLTAEAYFKWLHNRGLAQPLNGGSGEFLMLAGILFIVAQVFKKGVELQQDNELTV